MKIDRTTGTIVSVSHSPGNMTQYRVARCEPEARRGRDRGAAGVDYCSRAHREESLAQGRPRLAIVQWILEHMGERLSR